MAILASNPEAARILSILEHSFVGTILEQPIVEARLAGQITGINVPEAEKNTLGYAWTGWDLVVKSDQTGENNKIPVGDIYPSNLLKAIFEPKHSN